jgi:hypothetical protein
MASIAARRRYALNLRLPHWILELAIMALAAGGLALAFTIQDLLVRVLLAVTIGAFLVVLAFVDPKLAVPATLGLLLVLGTIRRETSYLFADDLAADPYLAIIPLVSGVLFLVALRHGALRNRTKLSKVALGFTIVTIVGALNPLQGGFTAAPLGLAILLPPLLWFWIARGLIDDATFARLLRVVLVVGVLMAAYGLFQSYGYFTKFDRYWFENLGDQYVSIRVGGGVVRPFGFSSSAAEYGKILAVGLVIIVGMLLYKRSLIWLGAVITGLLGVALLLSALRTTLVLAVAAIGLLYGVRRHVSVPRLIIFGSITVVILLAAVTILAPGGRQRERGPAAPGSNASVLTDRVVGGLSNPLESGDSTLGTHVTLVSRAMAGLASHPLGIGTASITIAGKRFGNSQAGDMDIADAAIAFGIVGVVLYVLLVVRLIQRSTEVARVRHDWLALAALGIVAVTALQWLNGGLYGATFLPWLTFGWLDRVHTAKGSFGPLETVDVDADEPDDAPALTPAEA